MNATTWSAIGAVAACVGVIWGIGRDLRRNRRVPLHGRAWATATGAAQAAILRLRLGKTELLVLSGFYAGEGAGRQGCFEDLLDGFRGVVSESELRCAVARLHELGILGYRLESTLKNRTLLVPTSNAFLLFRRPRLWRRLVVQGTRQA